MAGLKIKSTRNKVLNKAITVVSGFPEEHEKEDFLSAILVKDAKKKNQKNSKKI